jgi:thiamine-phosphate pyrophosphorylase
MLIGYSAHAVDEAVRAAADGADFVTFGPVYPTPSKAMYGAPVGIGQLAEAARTLNIPLFALGGVKKTSIVEIMAAGASGIALISAVMAAHDPKAEAASLLHTMKQYARTP